MDDDARYRVLLAKDARWDGRLFFAVLTTGIYCRPICPSRTPKRTNVRFFQSPAAAQKAGFRPCLRCRPEVSPQVLNWRGPSHTVARALRLIEAGMLDEGNVGRLAAQLGIGERQLRRLFARQVGASPVAVAQTRRVLFAKQLLHETNLSMTDVALAAGFGSVRRFNETFQELFQRPPAQLRRISTDGSVERRKEGIVLRLPYRPPYDWDAVVGFLAMRAIPGVEAVADGRYLRTIALGAESGTIAVEPGEGAYLQATIHFSSLRALPSIVARVRNLFDLGADPAAIGDHLSRDPILAWRVAAHPGLRVPGAWDGFELATRAVLGQQITVAAATRLAGRLVARYGSPLPGHTPSETGLTHLFPPPDRLAGEDLSLIGMPKARARTLSGIAAAAAADPGLLGVRPDLARAVRDLRELPGIGEWTAQYIAMRQLREPDAMPAGDVGLLRALTGPDGRRPSHADLLERAERWRPWRAYATLHLWTSESGRNTNDLGEANA